MKPFISRSELISSFRMLDMVDENEENNQSVQVGNKLETAVTEKSDLVIPTIPPIVINLDEKINSKVKYRLQNTNISLIRSNDINAFAGEKNGVFYILISEGLLKFIDFAVGISFLSREMEKGKFSAN